MQTDEETILYFERKVSRALGISWEAFKKSKLSSQVGVPVLQSCIRDLKRLRFLREDI